MNNTREHAIFLQHAKKEIKRKGELFFLTIASAILAALGIALDNIFILLGAMLVAPFFDPIISVVIFIFEKNAKQFLKGIGVLGWMIIVTIGITFLTLLLLRSRIEISLALTALPDASFEYIIVAVLMGMIGTSMWIWPKTSNTSAGISTAISLVPPLAHISRALILTDGAMILSATGFFLLNLLGMIGGCIVTLFVHKYWKMLKKKQ